MNDPDEQRVVLKLFITGHSARSEKAIATLQQLCEVELGGRYELEIVDVLEHPEEAEQERIVATPTVVKRLPPPIRKVIGDLSDTDRVLIGLDIEFVSKS